jgi:glucosamine-6-phosphate deaminase
MKGEPDYYHMIVSISKDASELGKKSADLIAETLARIIHLKGEARMVVSTGSSQFEMFRQLIQKEINWSAVEIFHLDEYIGLPETHQASFRKYLNERFISHIRPKEFHSVDVEGDVKARIRDLTSEIRRKPVDLGLIGIGVNGHIAFNDPPADFNTRDAYIIVKLDNQCKMQQVNEGWFGSVGEVPDEAVSMSVWQIMQCRKIVSVVPHEVKAEAVFKTLTSRLNPYIPATMLKQHPDWNLFLDRNSASKLISY